MGASDKLFGGRLDDFSDSLAEEIELAYNAVLAENGKKPLPAEGQEDRRLLFLAIGRGVVNHLNKKGDAIQVIVPANPSGQTLKADVLKR